MKQWHLLAYDVRDEKRLRKVHYYLRKRAVPLQKSVFLLHCSAADLATTLQGVRERAHLREDDIRLYPVHTPAAIWAAGQQNSAVEDLYAGKASTTPADTGWLQQLKQTLFG